MMKTLHQWAGFAVLSVVLTTSAMAQAAPCGTPLPLSSDASHWDYKVAAAYLKNDAGSTANETSETIYAGYTDLNRDGKPEVFALTKGPLSCGSHGCQLVLLKQAPDKTWHQLNGWIAFDITLGNTVTNGYRDVYLNGVKLWRWTGKTYDIAHPPAKNVSWVDSQNTPDCQRAN